jgi:hypothetical protein
MPRMLVLEYVLERRDINLRSSMIQRLTSEQRKGQIIEVPWNVNPSKSILARPVQSIQG